MSTLSFAQALNLGLQPREYDAVVPVGEFFATLDFRVWGKSVNLRCFFTHQETGEKFTLSAFRSHFGEDHIVQRPDGQTRKAYAPEDGSFDFSEGDFDGRFFRLVTRQGKRGNILWSSAELLPRADGNNGG